MHLIVRKVNRRMKSQRCEAIRVVDGENWEDYIWPSKVDYMDNGHGHCMHCKCHWSKHTNMKYKPGKKSVSVRELEEKYNAAVKNCDDQTDVLQKVKEKQDQLSKEFQATIEDVR